MFIDLWRKLVKILTSVRYLAIEWERATRMLQMVDKEMKSCYFFYTCKSLNIPKEL